MDGIRVSEIGSDWTKNRLIKYFQDVGDVKIEDIYYPLLNNEAVILFGDSLGPIRITSRKHEKFKVTQLPYQVFSKIQAWVDPEMSMMVRTSETHCQQLMDHSSVEIITDTVSQQLILSGTTYQIESAWHYLSGLRDDQFFIASMLQKKGLSSRSFLAGKDLGTKSTHLPNGDVAHKQKHSPASSRHQDSDHSGESLEHTINHFLPEESRAKQSHINSPRGRVQERSSTLSTPREGLLETNVDSLFLHSYGRLSPDHSSIVSSFDRNRQTSRLQQEANKTFNNFASLQSEGTSKEKSQERETSISSTATSSRSKSKTLSDKKDEEAAELAHKKERQNHSHEQTKVHSEVSDGNDRHLNSLDFIQNSLRAETYGRLDESRKYSSLPLNSYLWKDELKKSDDKVGGASGGAITPNHFLHSERSPNSSSSVEEFAKSFSISKHLTLKINYGDIVEAQTNAIVNPANWELKNIGGVAGVLAQAAGPELAKECESIIRRRGQLKTAEVVKTQGYGKLKHLKCILHTVGPLFSAYDQKKSVYELTETFLNCLKFADELLISSITFPFISTGVFGMPVELCVLALFTAALVFSDRTVCYLTEIHLIHNDYNVVGEAIIAAKKIFKNEDSRSAEQRLMEGKRLYSCFVYSDESPKIDSIHRSRPLSVTSHRTEREPSPRPRSSVSQTKQRSNSLPRQQKSSSRDETDLGSSKKAPVMKQPLMATTTTSSKIRSSTAKERTSGLKNNHSSRIGASKDLGHLTDTEDSEETCPVCLEVLDHPCKLPCGHVFCKRCIDRAVKIAPRCPKCQRNFGIPTGNQPEDGKMSYRISLAIKIPGVSQKGAIVIDYYFPDGTQQACHPQPGKRYKGIFRTAYLPNTVEGQEVLKMLEKAFKHRLVFTIGDSRTTGASDVLTWNDIHHKTNIDGGPSNFGYPDPDYLKRVKEELAAKGITSP